jgi:hypothetical protein
MSDQTRVEQLLVEIRDTIARREDKYEEYLKESKKSYVEQVASSHQRNRKWALVQWVAWFVIIYTAVYFAVSNAR